MNFMGNSNSLTVSEIVDIIHYLEKHKATIPYATNDQDIARLNELIARLMKQRLQ